MCRFKMETLCDERNRFWNAGYSVGCNCVGSLFTLIFNWIYMWLIVTVQSVNSHLFQSKLWNFLQVLILDPNNQNATSANIVNVFVEFLDWHQTKWNVLSFFWAIRYIKWSLLENYWMQWYNGHTECSMFSVHPIGWNELFG